MTLMKLCLDSPYKDLAYRFGVSVTTVSRVFSKWLTLMDTVLRSLIIWPDRDSLWKTMPKCLPAYTKGKSQLSPLEVEETRNISNVRIHVERVIGAVHQKYSILRGTLPVDFLIKKTKRYFPTG